MKRLLAVAISVTLAVAISVAHRSNADEIAPFAPIEPSQEEAWSAVCRDIAVFVADECYRVRDESRWERSFIARVDAGVPAKIAQIRTYRASTASRQNVAYREMLRRGITPEDALVLCEDPSILQAYLNARAGVTRTPNVVIEGR